MSASSWQLIFPDERRYADAAITPSVQSRKAVLDRQRDGATPGRRPPRGWGLEALRVIAVAAVAAAAAIAVLVPTSSWAEDLEVPARVQVELVGKLASYDRNFLVRAGEKATVAIVARPGDVDSVRAASQLQAALKDMRAIAGLPHEEIMVSWKGVGDLADLCAKRRLAIVYLTPGLAAEINSISKALDGKNVLTVASVLTYVGKGAVLGFELVSGRPKLVINLGQAKKQNVQFRAEVLRLMRIVE